jgi:DNA recombination protein RmuC
MGAAPSLGSLTLFEGALVALAVGLAVTAVALAVALRRARRDPLAALAPRLEALHQAQERAERMLRQELATSRTELTANTRHLREEVGGSIRSVGETVEKRLDVVRGAIDLRLHQLQQENQKKLDEMRATVDEKLQGTLERRLGEAFQLMSERLEAVHKGLGEMQSLALSVGDLKRVLTNVKTRGTYGETQLESLLEQMLAPGQYAKQLATKPGSAERVDFAVRLPGANGDEPCWLPIDAKFPQEDYGRLVEAHERGDAVAAELASRALEARVKMEARAIREKYLSPPQTTDFALLFLPTESLYAEILRRPGLFESLQRDQRVVVAGPTTLAAILNSLQMGFRTLAIQQRSNEVWQLLGAVKTQFGKFGELLDKVQKKLGEASNTLESASAKSRFIQQQLKGVEELPAPEAQQLLPTFAEEARPDGAE